MRGIWEDKYQEATKTGWNFYNQAPGKNKLYPHVVQGGNQRASTRQTETLRMVTTWKVEVNINLMY